MKVGHEAGVCKVPKSTALFVHRRLELLPNLATHFTRWIFSLLLLHFRPGGSQHGKDLRAAWSVVPPSHFIGRKSEARNREAPWLSSWQGAGQSTVILPGAQVQLSCKEPSPPAVSGPQGRSVSCVQ